jgi:signal transduction histidine kinase
MLRRIMIAVTALALISSATFAQQGGTADEARAMLDKAVAAIKADKTKALETFNKGKGGYLDRDLYVFCAEAKGGKIVANGNPNAKKLLGTDLRKLKDSNGKPYGEEIFTAGQKPEGQVTEISGYLFPKPSDPKPAPKNSFVTKVGDLFCGVGYYK